MKYMVVIGIAIIILVIIILFFKNVGFRFSLLEIKIKEASSNIDLFLQKKKNILERIIKEITQIDKYKDEFNDFVNDTAKKNDSFKTHTLLNKYYTQVSKIIFDDDNILDNEKIINLLQELKDNEGDLIGSIKFYNDTIVDYNGLIKVFPYNLIAGFSHKTEKEFYNNEKEEMFEILK